MNISRINILLKENEKIKTKIGEIKRKLNLKNYTAKQKEEFVCIIKMLKNIYYQNQAECSKLSEMKAENFANLVCKVLNKNGEIVYRPECVLLDLPTNSAYAMTLKSFQNFEKSAFLIVRHKKINKYDPISLNNILQIPISYISSTFPTATLDEYTRVMLEQQRVHLFESPDCESLNYNTPTIKTFNLGVAGEKIQLTKEMRNLQNLIKKELGICINQKMVATNVEKQQ